MATDVVASVRERVRAVLSVEAFSMVVAVSGGPDSVCLLDAVAVLASVLRCEVTVGHVDHQLRPDSAEDAALVSELAAGYGLRCEVRVVDVAALAGRESLGIEEAGRVGRYHALSALACKVGSTTILTGHTRSDAVETLLMHVLRGAGGRGLASLPERAPIDPDLLAEGTAGPDRPRLEVVRPLRHVDRAETVAYCAALGIAYRHDPTNVDPTFLRNRVRQHLLPVLRTYNPAVDAALDRLAQSASEDDQYLADVTEEWFRDATARADDGAIVLDLAAWQRLHPALRRRLVRRSAGELGIHDVGFDAVERALLVAEWTGPPRTELGDGLVVERAGGQLVFRRDDERPGRGRPS